MSMQKWSEDLATGIAGIDDDHRHLFEVLDRLYQAIREDRGHEELVLLLSELIGNTEDHFRREESFMLERGYRDFARHKMEHERLIADARDLLTRYQSGALQMTISVQQILGNWLRQHISVMDREMVGELKAI